MLLTDEIDVGTLRPADPRPDLGELGRVQVRLTASDPAADLFVGIGPRDAVRGYLAGTSHDEFVGATTDPFRARFDRVPGRDFVAAPGAQSFWVARANGGPDVTLEWDKTTGPWSLVVANAAGGPGLDVRAALGLRFSFLTPLGGGLLVVAVLLLLALAATTRRPRPPRDPCEPPVHPRARHPRVRATWPVHTREERR